MDPFSESSDGAIWSALESVHLKKQIEQLGRGLDSLVSEAGQNFSVGQRQLMCLARCVVNTVSCSHVFLSSVYHIFQDAQASSFFLAFCLS